MSGKAILLHPDDDVATALTDLAQGETVEVGLGERATRVTLGQDIPFAHKYALRDIAQGEPILKYGLPIGSALEPIAAGAWVHVHNCRSDRFGHRHQKYGINA